MGGGLGGGAKCGCLLASGWLSFVAKDIEMPTVKRWRRARDCTREQGFLLERIPPLIFDESPTQPKKSQARKDSFCSENRASGL